jgi:hypothetical protein
MYVSVKKRRHGKLAKCFVRRDCALYLRAKRDPAPGTPGSIGLAYCVMVTLRAGPWLFAGCWGRHDGDIRGAGGRGRGASDAAACHSCRHGSRGYKQQTELQIPPLRRAFTLAPYRRQPSHSSREPEDHRGPVSRGTQIPEYVLQGWRLPMQHSPSSLTIGCRGSQSCI